ncbi:DMT family transporter [Rhodovulum sp. DZ06]|uniref:DMT family transporter n=1 Tax=Rhodovulum sp. DZ06 TaxID=3425126 RepID=UPI003D33DF21
MSADLSGIALRIGAAGFFTLMAVSVKMLAGEVPLGQVVFFRSALALVPLVLFLGATGDFPRGLRTRRPLGHALRCALGCAAMFASFAALRFLPLADAAVLGYLAPLLSVLLARALLGEAVSRARWVAVGLSLGGVLSLLAPQLGGAAPDGAYLVGVGLGLAAALLTAGAKIQIRALAMTENAGAIALYFALTCAAAGLATAPFGWVAPDPVQLSWLVCAGASGGIAHVMMTLAMQRSEVSRLAPVEYLSLVFAALADALAFGARPDPAFFGAASCIVAATVIAVAEGRGPRRARAG